MPHWHHIFNASRLLDPGSGVDRAGEIWVKDGVIHALTDVGAPRPEAVRDDDTVEAIDANGALVTPMFIDIHVHFRQPGQEAAETIRTGSASALRGGYAVVYAMANTAPTCDAPEHAEFVQVAAREAGDVEVVPVSALSHGLRGRDLVDMDAMAAAGATAFSDDGAWLADEKLAREALRWTAKSGGIVMQHCEDFAVTGPGVIHECSCTHGTGLPGIPRDAEDKAVRRDIQLAEDESARLHVCHVSTAGAVDAIRAARERGVPVTAEVTPHHLTLTAEDAVAGGPDFKMKPPLREAEDVTALREALADGTIQALATDHAPHSDDAKAVGFEGAPFGAIGLETAFAAVYTGCVREGPLPLERLVDSLTSGPAAVVSREPPRLSAGAPARINLIDLETPRVVDREGLASRSHNCPFHGHALRGWPLGSLVGTRFQAHFVGSDVRNRTT